MEKNNIKDGLMFKMDDDPRIIKEIGHFILLWTSSPQFWNILKGDMSLVGTRPPTMDEWEKYELHHRKRLAIKPGLTGMWQVSGRSEITDFEEVVELDTKYIEQWSIGLDIKILFNLSECSNASGMPGWSTSRNCIYSEGRRKQMIRQTPAI